MANVLVIDDDQDITRLLQTQLSEEGHRVTVAHQGDEGLAKALKAAPDLIMLDVFLPDATGYQICNQIRKNAATESTPVIMMTGAARFPNQQQFGLDRGANEYILKPFQIFALSELVNSYIGMKRKKPSTALAVRTVKTSLPNPIPESTLPLDPAPPEGTPSELSTFIKQAPAKTDPSV